MIYVYESLDRSRHVADPGGVDSDPTVRKKPDPTVKKKPELDPTLEKIPDPNPKPWL